MEIEDRSMRRRLRLFSSARPDPSGPLERAVDADVISVRFMVDEADEATERVQRDEAWRRLRRTLAEAVILQDAAEEILADVRDRPMLGEVAPPCGRLKSRFVRLAEELPSVGDPLMDAYTAELRPILEHHVLMLKAALDLLACAWPSERLCEEMDRIDGLGLPARRLESIREEILARAESGAAVGSDP
jgi:hypothetical protein